MHHETVEVRGKVRTMSEQTVHADLRDQALKRLKKRHDFVGHLLVYGLVNTFLVVIWAATNPGGFFWPVFPMVGWGIGVVMNAWDVFMTPDYGEDDIDREINRMLRG
jgi:hypothetical protein